MGLMKLQASKTLYPALCKFKKKKTLSLEEHAFRISEIISSENISVSHWLRMASGLTSINFNLLKHDDSLWMCGMGRDYWNAKSDHAEQLYLELTRFLFIWNAIETYVGEEAELANSSIKKYIANRVERFESHPDTLPHFACVANAFERSVRRVESLNFIQKILENESLGRQARLVRGVEQVRHGFAHGQLELPMQAENSVEDEVRAFRIASRLALFIFQFLLLRLSEVNDIAIFQHSDDEGNEMDDLPLSVVVLTLHLESED